MDWGSNHYRIIKLINNGGVVVSEGGEKGVFWLDNLYLAQWTDVELGNPGNDFIGCDTTLNLGYVYNGRSIDEEFRKFKLAPPAVGYALLQGPRISVTGSSRALFDRRAISAWRNLPMTSFINHRTGDPFAEPGGTNYEHTTLVWHKLLRCAWLSKH